MDITAGLTQKSLRAFPAFKYRDYRLYFSGQLVSLVGTWMQTVAQGWLVWELTRSAFWVGLVASIGSLPILLFTLFGGVLVDRFNKRTILVLTQTSSMILAFILAILTILGVINVYEICALAFLLGTINSIDTPARQSFVIELVGRDDLPSAIALNAGSYNTARVIGPGLAGMLIGIVGTGVTFLLNGFSFVAVIIALLLMKVKHIKRDIHPHPLIAIKEGITYSLAHPLIRTLLLLAGITSIFGWSYTTIMPVVATKVFGLNAVGFGVLHMITGFGAIVGMIIVSAFSKHARKTDLILAGNFIFTLSLISFSFISNLKLAVLPLFLAGFGLIVQFSTINSTIQQNVSDHIRGRVMSLYVLMFLGMTPIGSFLMGFLAEHFGPMFTIRLGAIVLLLFGAFLVLKRNRLNFQG